MIDIPDRWLPRWRSTTQSRVVCWEIERVDGEVLRFTSWDKPLYIESRVFLPRDDEESGIDESGGGQYTGDTRQASLKERSAGLAGVLSSESIKEEDLRAGRFDGATVRTYLVDARATSLGNIESEFRVADVRWSTDGSWRISVVSALDAALQQKRGEIVSRTCRNTLFGARCARARTPGGSDGLVADEWEIGQTSGNYCTVSQVDNDFTIRVQIPAATIVDSGPRAGTDSYVTFSANHYFCGETAASARPIHCPVLIYSYSGGSPDLNGEWDTATTGDPPFAGISIIIPGTFTPSSTSATGFACLAPPAGWFTRGKILWRTGANAGLTARIGLSTAFTASPSSGFGGYVTMTLDAEPINAVQVGDTCSVVVGCDLQSATCSDRFQNIVNFNGEPFTPTADVLLNTPKAS